MNKYKVTLIKEKNIEIEADGSLDLIAKCKERHPDHRLWDFEICEPAKPEERL